MEIRQLRYFMAIARYGSFTAASNALFVAQPALSIQIAKLESELGCVLFERGAHGARPTAAGDEMVRHAEQVLQRLDALGDAVRAASNPRVVVRLGVPPLVSLTLTLPLLAATKRQFPGITLQIQEVMTGTLRDLIAHDGVDLALMNTLAPGEFPQARLLMSEALCVCGLAEAGFNWPAALHFTALAEVPLVVSTTRNCHRQVLENLARAHGFALKIAAEVDSLSRMHELVAQGHGAMVTSRTGLAAWPAQLMTISQLIGTEDAWHTNLVIAERRARSAGVQEVAGMVAEILQQQDVAGPLVAQSAAC